MWPMEGLRSKGPVTMGEHFNQRRSRRGVRSRRNAMRPKKAMRANSKTSNPTIDREQGEVAPRHRYERRRARVAPAEVPEREGGEAPARQTRFVSSVEVRTKLMKPFPQNFYY